SSRSASITPSSARPAATWPASRPAPTARMTTSSSAAPRCARCSGRARCRRSSSRVPRWPRSSSNGPKARTAKERDSMGERRADRVLVIGLDCATPQFVFGPDRFDMPNLQAVARAGGWGLLRSCDPPITVPAWACMTSTKDPGTLGVYGFRNRKDNSYDGMSTANATAIKEMRVWDILSRSGKKVAVVGVPQTYPVKPVNGWLTSGFLAPDTSVDFAYPKALKAEVLEKVGDYIFDAKDFRTDEKDRLLKQIYALMHNRFDVAKYLMTTKPWDFF